MTKFMWKMTMKTITMMEGGDDDGGRGDGGVGDGDHDEHDGDVSRNFLGDIDLLNSS